MTATHFNTELSTIHTLHVGGTDADETTMRQLHGGDRDGVTQECCLVQIYPADVVQGMLLLEAKRLVVGRDSSVDWMLAHGSVSRQHAELTREPGGYCLRDLGSTNGTLVNGERIASRHLKSGDTIQIGSFIFKFLSAGSVESKYHETVYSAMTRDALTGAMNKRYLLESLKRETARALRQKQSLAVVMIDIDYFKRVNDTHGHLVGDEVLREFGRRLLAVCREDDLLARYGGEEFSLLLCATDVVEACSIAERCRLVVASEPFLTAAGLLAITASFGIATLAADGTNGCTDLIQAADAKLYQAKRNGRNQVVA